MGEIIPMLYKCFQRLDIEEWVYYKVSKTWQEERQNLTQRGNDRPLLCLDEKNPKQNISKWNEVVFKEGNTPRQSWIHSRNARWV